MPYPRIFYFTPYHPDGLGRAYNDHCELLPDDDSWAVIQDTDVIFFSSQLLGQQISEVVGAHPDYQVFTCVTNRINQNFCQQLREPGLREERDLVRLKQAADRQMKLNRGKVVPVQGLFGGYFMVFQKKLWKQFPFPAVGMQGGKILGIDTTWGSTLQKNGVKIGLMLGLMAVHFFRLDARNEKDRSHIPDPGFMARGAFPSRPAPRPPNKIRLNPSLRPPGGFKFRDEDGIVHFATDEQLLIRNVTKYRQRIGRPLGDPAKEIVAQIYARYPQVCIVTR